MKRESTQTMADLFKVVCLSSLLLPSAAVLAQTTQKFVVSASVANGVVAVNQGSGAVSFCAGTVSTAGKPLTGSCSHLGIALITTGAASSLSLVVTTSSSVFYVINNTSGQVTECGAIVSNGVPTGSCAVIGTAK